VSSPLLENIEKNNAQIGALLTETRRALTGQAEFGVGQVRALSKLIIAMGAIVERTRDQQKLPPEITGQLDVYRAYLHDLQPALERVSMMLLAQKTRMDAGRGQIEAVTKWAAMLGQTR
jgi:hypothetical protein